MAPIYSEDLAEEARMLTIRDAPCRVTAMARCRVDQYDIPLTSAEQLWLEERFVTGRARDADFIPVLQAREWAALARAILQLVPRRPLRQAQEAANLAYDPGTLSNFALAHDKLDRAEVALMKMLGSPEDGLETLRALDRLPAHWQHEVSIECVRSTHMVVARRASARIRAS